MLATSGRHDIASDQHIGVHSSDQSCLDSGRTEEEPSQTPLPVSTAADETADADVPDRCSRSDQQRHQPSYAAQDAAHTAKAAASHIAITVSDDAALQRDCSMRGLQRSATSLSSASQQGPKECRICLASDNQEDLVQPCSCTGSVQYAHMECLKAWVQERCNLQVCRILSACA